MKRTHVFFTFWAAILTAAPLFAQPPAPAAPPPPPPPLWDMQIGASFVGTSGNSETATTGVDFAAHRRGLIWQIESAANAVRSTSVDVLNAERYVGTLRGRRKLNAVVGVSSGVKLERDPFSGLDFRSIVDGSLSWALVHQPRWTVDGETGVAWLHEARTTGATINDPVGLLQVLSRVPFGTAGDMTQRFTFYPDFKMTAAYRQELELTAQAAMNAHLALKIGYLLRYSNQPVPGFKQTDNTTTASVVLRWKATALAPAP